MKLIAWTIVAIGVLWYFSRQHRPDTMSREWIEHQRKEGRISSAHYEGVCWQWPVNRMQSERGWLNRSIERGRKRA